MEFVRVKYPRAGRVLIDGNTLRPTNKTFQVARGTHRFSIDEPAEPREIELPIELTFPQSPMELSFKPAADAASTEGGTRSIGGSRSLSPKVPPKKKALARKKRPSRAKPRGKGPRGKAASTAKPKRPTQRVSKRS